MLAPDPSDVKSRNVWTRPPFPRRQRDKTRVPHSARAADAEFCRELERGADRSPAGRALRCKGATQVEHIRIKSTAYFSYRWGVTILHMKKDPMTI